MSILAHAPRFSQDEALGLLMECYGLTGTVGALPSERDQNFLIMAADGRKYVLKIANAREERALLDAQQQAMTRVAEKTGLCPRVLPGIQGKTLFTCSSRTGQKHFLWLIEWLPGRLLARVKHRSKSLLESLGRSLARLDQALADFSHPALQRELYWNLDAAEPVIRENLDLIENPPNEIVGAQVARRDEEGSETLAAGQLPEGGLELIERDQPLSKEQVSKAIVGVSRAREDDPTLIDVDLFRDPARREMQHACRSAAAVIPQEVGDAQALETTVDKAGGEARFSAFVHTLSLVGCRPITGSRPVPGTPGPIGVVQPRLPT